MGGPMPGAVIDGYRIDAALHAGGNGFVYAVTPVDAADPGFPLVMKVPAVGPGQPPLAIVTYETEVSILRELTGPYVPRFVAAGEITATPYVVMERIEGEGLASRMAHAPLPVDDVARLGAALADALVSIHAQDVTHLDLKPENVMLRRAGGAVLLDFGYARHAHYPDLLAEERHFAAGSAAYVSPEQLNGVRGDRRSDLFALGAIVYQLATGEPPFGEPSTYAGMRDRLWRAPVPPRARVPAIPAWLQEIVLRLLEVDPDARYGGAAPVAFDFRHPEQVAVTDRGERTQSLGVARQLSRWWRAKRGEPPRAHAGGLSTPVILVAVDTEHPDDPRIPVIQSATRQLVAASPDYRLMCVSVIRAAPLGEGTALSDTASGRHLEHTVRLRHFAAPLGLPPTRLSLHVIESPDAADTLLELAHANHVDLLVLGAPRPGDRTLGWWRSTASTVTAQARCSVHLARVPERAAAHERPAMVRETSGQAS